MDNEWKQRDQVEGYCNREMEKGRWCGDAPWKKSEQDLLMGLGPIS